MGQNFETYGMLTHRFPSKEEISTAKKQLIEMGAVKLDRKKSGLTYSFLHHLESDSVYALSRHTVAYKGGQSEHVKILYNENQSTCIGKVAVFTKISDPHSLPEVKILKKLGRLYNVILRPLECAKPFKALEGTPHEYVFNINYKLYLIQTQIPGINLFNWLSIPENRTLLSSSPELQFQIALKLIARLHQLHTQYIVHGDIKPTNIVLIVDEYKEAQLEFVDFGNSVILEKNCYETSVHYQCGTPRYRAPEQEIKQGSGFILGYAGDVYSLSVLLQNNLHLLLPNKSMAQFLRGNRLERASLAQLATCIFEELISHDSFYPVTNPTLKILLEYFKSVLLDAKFLQKSLTVLANDFSKEKAILTEVLLRPSTQTMKNAISIFKIQKPKMLFSFRQPHIDQEYSVCITILTRWISSNQLESFIHSMKSKQKLLEDKNPFCQLYTELLGIIRHAQGMALLDQLDLYYPLNAIKIDSEKSIPSP